MNTTISVGAGPAGGFGWSGIGMVESAFSVAQSNGGGKRIPRKWRFPAPNLNPNLNLNPNWTKQIRI
jgi:hypothetical protein